MGPASPDSTNILTKIFGKKKSRKFQKAKLEFGDFFGDPVVKILHYHSRRSRFDTWSRN